jgi:hypothetical protein
MGPRNAYKDMLDNVVSPITCVSMNHQNQLEQMANGAMFATCGNKVVETVGWVGRPKKILTRRPQNEDINLSIRSKGSSEQVAAKISFVPSPMMIAGANCHHATRRAPNLPLPGALTVRW